MTAVITRIILRYLSGALVAYGIIAQEAGVELAVDPDLTLVIGGLVGAATEFLYAYAKRHGWTT